MGACRCWLPTRRAVSACVVALILSGAGVNLGIADGIRDVAVGAAVEGGRVGKAIYVSKLGDNSDGSSWASAFHTIQQGLQAVPDDQGGHRRPGRATTTRTSTCSRWTVKRTCTTRPATRRLGAT